MAVGHTDKYDFFLSRRGSVASVAREVCDVLTEKGYKVIIQDYDIPLSASFVEAMHEAVKNARDLVILFTRDYEQSPYTRKEFTSFEAERAQSPEERHIIVLRCEDVPLRGLLADNVYQDLVGITDPEERKRRIVAAAERRSQAAPPPPRPFLNVPPRIQNFAGRGGELDRLDTILMQNKPAAVTQANGRVAVQGLGGVGKTSLAAEYAYRYRQLYAGVCWCSAETRSSLIVSLAGLAVVLGAATEGDVENSGKAAIRCLNDLRSTWLLIYDNVVAPDEIADLLPSGEVRVLITSRFSDWGEWAEEVALDVLPLDEAIGFLQRRAGRSDAEGARILAEALGRLPLALDHAAAFCKRTHFRFVDYAGKVSSLITAAPRGVGYPKSVAATFDLAISESISQCATSEDLMAYLAHCAPERVPMSLVEGAIEGEEKRLQALAALTEVSLVKHDPFEDGTPAITLHRLVRAVARTRSNARGTSQQAVERVIARLASIYPSDSYDNSVLSQAGVQLLPHMLTHSRLLWPRAASRPEKPTSPGLIKNILSRLSRLMLRRSPSAASETQLTVMFCDLAGTTAASERLSPEEVVQLLSSFENTCAEVIAEFHGSVAKYMADSVLAYFGYPNVNKDDAAHSIHAGLAIVARWNERQRSSVRYPVRVGIATGPVILGQPGRGSSTEDCIIVGDTLSLAARVQGLAGPNGVVITESTWTLASRAFVYEELGELNLRGIAAPVRAFRVIR